MGQKAHNKLTFEEVLQQFKETHGDNFDYSNSVYVDTHTPIEVRCKKHDYIFNPTPKNHKNGSKCYYCGREAQIEKAKKNREQFIREMFDLYGDSYDVSNSNYVNTKTEIEILCKNHGVFYKKPSDLLDGNACKKCGKNANTKSSNKSVFIEEAKKVYGDKDDYTETNIISAKEKVKVRCTKHNYIFEKNIQSYLSGCGCPKCSAENYSEVRTITTEDFISQAKEIHGDSCDYTDTIYTSCRDKVKIKCNKHNMYFETVPSNHIRGGRCRKCLSENISKALRGKEGTCGYSKSGYVNQAGDREAYVYLIKCWNEEEEFYKIGKTFLDINKRFTKSNLCYKFEKVNFHNGEAGYIYDLENKLHRKYKEFKYNPLQWFAGYTECYTTDLPIEEIINLHNNQYV